VIGVEAHQAVKDVFPLAIWDAGAAYTRTSQDTNAVVHIPNRSARLLATITRMAAPNLPPGFDFTDPDVYAQRLPVEELAELLEPRPLTTFQTSRRS
jgi:hypothetical protein